MKIICELLLLSLSLLKLLPRLDPASKDSLLCSLLKPASGTCACIRICLTTVISSRAQVSAGVLPGSCFFVVLSCCFVNFLQAVVVVILIFSFARYKKTSNREVASAAHERRSVLSLQRIPPRAVC
jgi:spore maturation protein SpmA